jgi:disulfide bond formation protein DsbB
MGDGNCAETQWTLLGLSIPEQTLLLFIAVAIVSLWQTLRHYP